MLRSDVCKKNFVSLLDGDNSVFGLEYYEDF